MKSVGIIGGGFSGLSTLAALVRHAAVPLHITIYHPDSAVGRGRAYSTQDPGHLLNVRAAAMGAHAGQDDDFHAWLIARHMPYDAGDFASRALYGRYLDHVLAQTLVAAQGKDIRVFMAHEKALDVQPAPAGLLVKTAVGQYAHDAAILACGNDRPRTPALGQGVARHAGWWKHPYQADRWRDIARAGHIIIIGSGLSMIDALVTLVRAQYDGDITVLSRHGQIPMAHPGTANAFLWDAEDIERIRTPALLMRQVRLQAVRSQADWRDVLDGLRPQANTIWRRFSAADRKRAQRYMSFWNNRRHRIPQVMHDMVSRLSEQGQLRLIAGRVDKVEAMGRSLNVYTSAGVKEGQIVINCLGYDYGVVPDGGGLLSELATSGMVGVADGFPYPARDCLQMHARHPLYGVGPLWQGYFIESTAVRDIRLQADQVARDILKSQG